MIVIGIDPGLANTGYGVVVRRSGRVAALDGGVIRTRPELAAERRLALIYGRVLDLIDQHEPGALALEELYFGQNAGSAFAVGQARGVAALAAGQRSIECASYTPQQIKAAVCGNGRAPKEQVGRMVATLLGLDAAPASDHAADALAVAICHVHRAPLATALAAGVAAEPRRGRLRRGRPRAATHPADAGQIR